MEKYQRNHSKHSYTCFNFNIQHFHSSLSSQKHIFIIIFPFFSFDNNPKYLQILINTYKNPAHPIFLSFPFFLFPSLFHSSLEETALGYGTKPPPLSFYRGYPRRRGRLKRRLPGRESALEEMLPRFNPLNRLLLRRGSQNRGNDGHDCSNILSSPFIARLIHDRSFIAPRRRDRTSRRIPRVVHFLFFFSFLFKRGEFSIFYSSPILFRIFFIFIVNLEF